MFNLYVFVNFYVHPFLLCFFFVIWNTFCESKKTYKTYTRKYSSFIVRFWWFEKLMFSSEKNLLHNFSFSDFVFFASSYCSVWQRAPSTKEPWKSSFIVCFKVFHSLVSLFFLCHMWRHLIFPFFFFECVFVFCCMWRSGEELMSLFEFNISSEQFTEKTNFFYFFLFRKLYKWSVGRMP